MLAKKKKISKKHIKEDKLVSTYYKVQKFYEDNQSKIFIVGGILAVIIIAVFWYTSKIEQDNLSATTALSRILSQYETGSYQAAIDGTPGTNIIGLAKIVDDYGGSEQGETTRIYLAHSYYYLGNIDEAMEQYNDYSGSNELLIATALAGKASCYEVKEDYESAADSYMEASSVSSSNPQNPDYLLNAGINYIKSNSYDDAKESLTILKKEYKNSNLANNADKYLALIGE
ncbi:hypothetical protein ACFLS9_08565 [Bacteroidota bacterium]